MATKKQNILLAAENDKLQTETEFNQIESILTQDASGQEDKMVLCQTETEMAISEQELEAKAADVADADDSPGDQEADCQTESENTTPEPELSEMLTETEAEALGDQESAGEEIDSGQTETKQAKKPRRRQKTDEVKTQSDIDTVSKGDDAVARQNSSKRRASSKTETVMSIDAQRTVETEADKAKNDLLDLIESLKTGRVLAGTIQGVERTASNQTMAVIYHGAFKVVIPAEEAVEAPADFRDQSPADVYHYMLTKRLGAEVDYVIKGIDQNSSIAVASRLDAMRTKRKQYYFGTDREGNNLLYAGACAESRVVSVIRAGIFIDLFGLEVYIPLKELSYQRMMDATVLFRPGQRILVKILDIDRSDRNHIKAVASVKQAGENPYEKALRRYTVDNRYVGTVSMVDTNGVFVALDGGIDCLCSYPKRGRPPRGARVTVRILGINHETNRIWGAITHIATSG